MIDGALNLYPEEESHATLRGSREKRWCFSAQRRNHWLKRVMSSA